MRGTIIFAIIAMMAIGSALVGCSGRSAPEPGRYYDRDKRFSITFPEEWMIREGDGENWSTVEAVSPWENDYDQFSEYVTVDVEELGEETDVGVYFQATTDLQIDDTPGYRERGRGDATIGDINAKWVTFDFESEGGMVTVLGYALVKGQRGYLVSCVGQASKFSTYRTQFIEIVNSFRPE